MEYNVSSFCVLYMIQTEERYETLAAFKYATMPSLPGKGNEFKLIRNNTVMSYKIMDFLGTAYSIDPSGCMQSFTYIVQPVF
jgi:hypothetical protein